MYMQKSKEIPTMRKLIDKYLGTRGFLSAVMIKIYLSVHMSVLVDLWVCMGGYQQIYRNPLPFTASDVMQS